MEHDAWHFVFDNMEVNLNQESDGIPRVTIMRSDPPKFPPTDDLWIVVASGLNGKNGIFSSPVAAEPQMKGISGTEIFTFSINQEAVEYLELVVMTTFFYCTSYTNVIGLARSTE
jgi:hypothetical protein